MPGSGAHVGPALADKVEFLRRGAWPGEPVDEVETHMSWVFLTGERAYKLKKPVAYGFVDYRTLEARRRDCLAEVELNEALAPGVYLGVEPLVTDDHGAISVGGPGDIVDWLVVMRRLPAHSLLDQRIARGRVAPRDLDPVIDRLVDFYASTPPRPMGPDAYRGSLHQLVLHDVAELRRFDGHAELAEVGRLADRLGREVERLGAVGGRSARLVDGHGDLRPEHIVPGPPPLVIDRLSFDARLRRVDPLFDLALPALECEMLGTPVLGEYLLRTYQARSGDHAEPSLVELYRSVRAMTRSRLSIAHLDDPVDAPQRWVRRSARYLGIARRHLDRIAERPR